jgi:hypothetical protein
MSREKYKYGETIWYSPRKGNFVTIDTADNYEMNDYENSAYEWCQELNGSLMNHINNSELESYTGFIKLFSRRYASYRCELEDYMYDNGFDAVFVDEDEFHFCGNKVNNITVDATEVYEDCATYGDFVLNDYGDDCCGYHNTYYLQNGVLYDVTENHQEI